MRIKIFIMILLLIVGTVGYANPPEDLQQRAASLRFEDVQGLNIEQVSLPDENRTLNIYSVPELKQRATDLIEKLYIRSYTPSAGNQAEYVFDRRFLEDSLYIAMYSRVWVYTQGIALEQALRHGDTEKAHQMARRLCEEIDTVTLDDGTVLCGGWHFSYNAKGDTFQDPRLVTGASAWALAGFGSYVASDVLFELPPEEQEEYRRIYNWILEGLLYHQREDGLFSAGWTVEELKAIQGQPNYYPVLNELGYHRGMRWVKAENVVTEHNLDMLAVLNRAVRNADRLGIPDPERILEARDRLRDGIFNGLYDPEQGRFVTGRAVTPDGQDVPSEHVAIDNASWLSLSVDYETLPPEYLDRLAGALYYTFDNFVKYIEYEDKCYYGAHYFLNRFEDPYIEQTDLQEGLYHMEATAGLILGLYKFYECNPDHPDSAEFRRRAERVWANMQFFVNEITDSCIQPLPFIT